jgi:hypothetical protein
MAKIVETTKSDHFVHYETLSDLDEDEVPEVNIDSWNNTQRGRDGDGEDWYGLGMSSPKEVMDAVKIGWPQGKNKAFKALSQIDIPRLPRVQRQKRRGDFGDFIDMQRVYSGNLDTAWERTERPVNLSKAQPHVTIGVNIGVNADTDSDRAFWIGATACNAVDALQKSGRNVKVIATWATENWQYEDGDLPNTAHFSVIIKGFDDPLTMDRLFAMTALTGFFRVYGFKAIEALPDKVSGGLGRSTGSKLPSFLMNSGAFISIDNSIRSKTDAEEYLKNLESKITWGKS